MRIARAIWTRWLCATAMLAALFMILPASLARAEEAAAAELNAEAEGGAGESSGAPAVELGPDERADIRAQIFIPSRPDSVWMVITDYDHLREFIPNLAESRLLEDHGSVKLIEQVAEGKWFVFGKRARVVLEVEEHKYSRVDFHVVDGDFSVFDGSWELRPGKGGHGTLLSYRLNVKSRFMAPGFMVKHALSRDIPGRLAAVRDRVMSLVPAYAGSASGVPTGSAK